MELNETTRTYPRSTEEAFPDTVVAQERRKNWQWMEESQESTIPLKPDLDAEFWVYITLAFAAGFLVHTLWG